MNTPVDFAWASAVAPASAPGFLLRLPGRHIKPGAIHDPAEGQPHQIMMPGGLSGGELIEGIETIIDLMPVVAVTFSAYDPAFDPRFEEIITRLATTAATSLQTSSANEQFAAG